MCVCVLLSSGCNIKSEEQKKSIQYNVSQSRTQFLLELIEAKAKRCIDYYYYYLRCDMAWAWADGGWKCIYSRKKNMKCTINFTSFNPPCSCLLHRITWSWRTIFGTIHDFAGMRRVWKKHWRNETICWAALNMEQCKSNNNN